MDLLTLGHGLHTCACARADARSNCGTFSSARESTNQCSYCGSASNSFSRPLPARGALFGVFVCLNLVLFPVEAHSGQHKRNLRTAGKVPCTLEVLYLALNIRILGNRYSPSG